MTRGALAALPALAALALLPAGCRAPRPDGATAPPSLTHGVAVGEVSDRGAVVWGRCDRAGEFHVSLDGGAREESAAAEAGRDFTARIALTGLSAGHRYAYRAWCSADGENAAGEQHAVSGRFGTAPAADDPRTVRVAWGGDLGGQNVCRDAQRGYPIFPIIAARAPDVFVALGDMIYADDPCAAVGRYGNGQIPGPPPARDRAGYWAHWRYNRADAGQQALLASVPMAAVWDDHEIVNDAGPAHDTPPGEPGPHLLPTALDAFLDYQPLTPPADDPTRLYRTQRWGRHLELFLLDTRQYRDSNAAPDSPGAPKSMLGPTQRRWLEEALAASTATWKVIVASVPLAIPTGVDARDGFASGDTAQGFEQEAAELFAVLRQRGIQNPLWITTDVHFASALLLRPIGSDPAWETREVAAGPLNAGLLPVGDLDPTFRPERLFLYAPPSADSVTTFGDAVRWFSFGMIETASNGRLSLSVVNGEGQTVYRMTLLPARR